MTLKRASQFWLVFLLLSIEAFLFLFHFELFLIEKGIILTLDALFCLAVYFGNKKPTPLVKQISFWIIALPVMYMAARFRVGSLQEPMCWVLLSKSLVQCLLLFYIDRIGDNWSRKINFYTPLSIIILLNVFFVLSFTVLPAWDTARHATSAVKVLHSLTG